jgi:N-methylhydantoinase B
MTDSWKIDGYLPAGRFQPGSNVPLHREAATDVDPATYEVIRYSLWNINLEHGRAMMNSSGSPIAAYDFNPTILTEDAEYVFYGPYIQFLSSSLDLTVKWVMENRADNPGINDGDIFVSNDCWVGATHQMDVIIACPVFWEGEIFCWIANTMHQYDLGGGTPGGFSTNAKDVYDEPLMVAPLKIVEDGVLRPDIEQLFTRSSRMAHIVELDIRAELAGCNVAKRRILEVIERYGAPTVKAVMRGIIDRAADSFKSKLEKMPDGVWRERGFTEQAFIGDRELYPIGVTITKEGDRLRFSNEDTAEAAGSMNMTVAGWRGAIVNGVAQQLGYDQMFAVGGLLRHLDFDPIPGTLLSARYPSAVSCGVNTMQYVLTLVSTCLGRMMSADEVLRRDVCIGGACSFSPIDALSATAYDGRRVGALLLDFLAGGIGAFAERDGIPTGGVIWDGVGRIPEIEEQEDVYPLMYLYRRQSPDSGGAGRWARGTTVETACVTHNTDAMRHDTASPGTVVPSGVGMWGGRPGGTNKLTFWRDSAVRAKLRGGAIPQSFEEAEAKDLELLPPRAAELSQSADDVWEMVTCGGAGYGDPLERDLDLLAEDLELGLISANAAEGVYGVVFDGAGPGIDMDKSTARRKEMRERRRGDSPVDTERVEGEQIAVLGEKLSIRASNGSASWCCRECSHNLGAIDRNYKDRAAITSQPLQDAGPYIDAREFSDYDLEFREVSCPACGALFDSEVARPEDPLLHDMQPTTAWMMAKLAS